MFDTIVCANGQLADRLSCGGVANIQTIRMGVEAGHFSPSLRSQDLRRSALAGLGLEPHGVLLIGIGRFSAEKRWDMVLRAAGECGRKMPVGLLLIGDGSKRQKLEMIAEQYRNVAVLRTDPRPGAARGAARERRRTGSRLRIRDLLSRRGRSARERNSADRPRSRGAQRIRSSPVPGRPTVRVANDRWKKRSAGSFIAGPSFSAQPRSERAAPERWTSISRDLFASYENLAPHHSLGGARSRVGGGSSLWTRRSL